MREEPILIGKIELHNKGEDMQEPKEKKPKSLSRMNLSELRRLHRDKSEIYWKLRSELNEISKLIQKKGG